jgi:hypothetical protein
MSFLVNSIRKGRNPKLSQTFQEQETQTLFLVENEERAFRTMCGRQEVRAYRFKPKSFRITW